VLRSTAFKSYSESQKSPLFLRRVTK